MKRVAPAADRNKAPIADVLAAELPRAGLVLEVGSGTGQHVAHFAERFPHLTFQPSDPDPDARASIVEWTRALPNVRPPLDLDARDEWSLEVDAILSSNVVHISEWAVTLGLLRNAKRLLRPGALLYLYGPYTLDGTFNSESNAAFDASLRARDPAWGLRDVRDVERAAEGFVLAQRVDMPANNYSLIFRRSEDQRPVT